SAAVFCAASMSRCTLASSSLPCLACSAAASASLAATAVVSARPQPEISNVAVSAIIEYFMVVLRMPPPLNTPFLTRNLRTSPQKHRARSALRNGPCIGHDTRLLLLPRTVVALVVPARLRSGRDPALRKA